MSQFYSDPSRENDPYALPDIEVFFANYGELVDGDGESCDEGWYWWPCFPGCIPDGGPNGPFATEEEALSDAQDNGE